MRGIRSFTKNKFSAKRCEYDGYKFDSLKEMGRYKELKLLENAGKINGLRLKPIFKFTHNKIYIGKYTPDFQYWEGKRNCDLNLVVEDVKGYKKGPSYTWFRRQCKMMLAFFNITVREI